MKSDRVVCSVCEAGGDIGYVGSDILITRYPVCRECYHSGKHERWRTAAIEELRGACVSFESKGNLADDLRTLRAWQKHNSRIDDGVCPNGCALLVWSDERHAECPKCHFGLCRTLLKI